MICINRGIRHKVFEERFSAAIGLTEPKFEPIQHFDYERPKILKGKWLKNENRRKQEREAAEMHLHTIFCAENEEGMIL